MQPLATRAPAKVNLTLHVLGRRADGYHELESLVAFAGAGDGLSLVPGRGLALVLDGPTASEAGPPDENLVLRAARQLQSRVAGLRTGTFRLTKRLPAAAGLGGGSSDAAAALRLLARCNDLRLDHPAVLEAAKATGADVTVCLQPRARMMRGVGEEVGPLLGLPRLFALLVNPRVPLATAEVFRALAHKPRQGRGAAPHPEIAPDSDAAALMDTLRGARNDLEAAAAQLAPVIRDVRDLVGGTEGCRLARMSGSGATVFGLFDDCTAAASAAKTIRRARPGWWVKATSLR
jgi:4-diphosphocytidyl-2-C-methyl-D-erythritol kinase